MRKIAGLDARIGALYAESQRKMDEIAKFLPELSSAADESGAAATIEFEQSMLGVVKHVGIMQVLRNKIQSRLIVYIIIISGFILYTLSVLFGRANNSPTNSSSVAPFSSSPQMTSASPLPPLSSAQPPYISQVSPLSTVANPLSLQRQIGITTESLTNDNGKFLRLPNGSEGVVVLAVAKGSMAARSGIRGGDLISTLNGVLVRTPDELEEKIGKIKIGEAARFKIQRKSIRIFVRIKLL